MGSGVEMRGRNFRQRMNILDTTITTHKYLSLACPAFGNPFSSVTHLKQGQVDISSKYPYLSSGNTLVKMQGLFPWHSGKTC